MKDAKKIIATRNNDDTFRVQYEIENSLGSYETLFPRVKVEEENLVNETDYTCNQMGMICTKRKLTHTMNSELLRGDYSKTPHSTTSCNPDKAFLFVTKLSTKMTKEEIEKELGYKIEIVESDANEN